MLYATLNMYPGRDINAIIQQMFDDVPGDSYQHKLNHLSNCGCCDRHQINKPMVFSSWHETHSNNNQVTYSCMCDCRHVARFICRQAVGYNPSPISRPNTPTSVINI